MARSIRVREVLRLRSMYDLSQNAIASITHVSKHSVQDVPEAETERNVSWEDVEGMSEEAAYTLLPQVSRGRRPLRRLLRRSRA